MGWLNLPHLDQITVAKDFKTTSCEISLRERETKDLPLYQTTMFVYCSYNMLDNDQLILKDIFLTY